MGAIRGIKWVKSGWVMEDRQNDQRVRRQSTCVEIVVWHEMYLIVKKTTRIAVISHAIEIRMEIQERTD